MGAGRGPGGAGGGGRGPGLDTGTCPPAPRAGTPPAPPAMEGPPARLGQSRGWRSPAPRGEQEEEEEEEQETPAVPWDPPPHLHDAVSKALFLPGSLQASGRARRDRRPNPGDSLATTVPSAVPSAVPCGVPCGVPSGVPCGVPTGSSVSPALSWWRWDAEEILHELGFVGTEPGVAARVPPRFFSAPSRASGIDLRLFLRAQARRLQMEDPGLLLASRFQRARAVAATAGAFFCLCSHVSRTPPQRIAPPPPCRDIPDMALPGGSRLKRAASSLCLHCLHTGGGHGDTPRGDTPRGDTLSAGGPGEDPAVPEGRQRDAGTARGHPERGCHRARGGLGGAPGDTKDPRPDVAAPPGSVAVSPRRGGLSPNPARDVAVSPRRGGLSPNPARARVLHLLSPQGDPGLGAWCHPAVTARVGGHRGGPPRVPTGLAPRGAAESLELEEVLSEEEEDGDDDDDEEEEEEEDDDDDEAAVSPPPSVRKRRSSMFRGRSDSGGFMEEPLPPLSPHCPHWVT